jgi:hypothetical protein
MANLDYSIQGAQTQFTDRVYEHVDNARSVVINNPKIAVLPEPVISIHRTCKYISQLPYVNGFNPRPRTREEGEANHRLKDSVFRQRDLDQVLKEGYYPTCSDIGLLFRGLMTAQGHPTAHVETFHEDYLFDRSFHGHVFGRVFDGKKSMLVNPNPNPIISDTEVEIFPYVIFREGLDSWDIGIRGYDDMHRLKDQNMESLLVRYEQNLRGEFQRKVEELQSLRDKVSHK